MQRVLLYVHNHPTPEAFSTALNACGIYLIPCTSLDTLSNQILRDKPEAILVLVDKPVSSLGVFIKTDKPVFIVTTHQQAIDRVNALKSGVKEYYIEPFPLTRLVYDLGSVHYTTELPSIQRYGVFEVDMAAQVITYRSEVLILGKKQFHLLLRLLKAKGSPVSRLQLWEAAWNISQLPQLGAIDTAIARMRKRLPSSLQSSIRPVYGIGYRLV
jgi:DNA-binding response OmpR family regulator